MTELSAALGRHATLDDIPDSAIDAWKAQGFDWIWLLSVWQTGAASRNVSRTLPEWLQEFRHTLLDLREEDIAGSGFAITAYDVHQDLGGPEALARLRARMHERGLKLMLDFVPNHMALDHPWVNANPDYFISGTDEDLQRSPKNYVQVATQHGMRIFAHGRDPYFPGWPDTLQLNYGNEQLQAAMQEVLVHIARQCDGVRCDMAMLVLPDIFQRTWNIQSQPFWTRAIPSVRSHVPDFYFMAEVYWDLEWELQQQGFDATYDKRLYDRLRDLSAFNVHQHLVAGLDFQNKLVRFLENHDEARAAQTWGDVQHCAVAAVTYLTPGVRFFHQGQFEGRRARISPHLVRAPHEPINANLRAFYDRLLTLLKLDIVRTGQWQQLDAHPNGDETHHHWLAFSWLSNTDERLLVLVNLSGQSSRATVPLPFVDTLPQAWFELPLAGQSVKFNFTNHGLVVESEAWGFCVLQRRDIL